MDVLRVAPAGDGADGVTCDLEPTGTELMAGPLTIGVDFLFADFAETLNVASEMPAMHNRTPNKLRAVTKPDLEEEDCFFI